MGEGVTPVRPGDGKGAVFHGCPPDPDCPYCSSLAPARGPGFDWSFLDGVYCISLQSRDDRTQSAARQFHRVGLCRHVLFYRPVKHPTSPKKGIWESHRVVAQRARSRGQAKVLVFEDDVVFSRLMRPRTVLAIGSCLSRLPPEWMGFFLGHWPLWARFVRWRTLRTSSFCTHAYVANRHLIDWLCEHPYSKRIPKVLIGGKGIDSAFAALPQMYAFFPMVALQSGSPGDHMVRGGARRRLRDYVLTTGLRDPLLSHLMRPSEVLAVGLSPLFSIWYGLKTLARRLGGNGRSAPSLPAGETSRALEAASLGPLGPAGSEGPRSPGSGYPR